MNDFSGLDSWFLLTLHDAYQRVITAVSMLQAPSIYSMHRNTPKVVQIAGDVLIQKSIEDDQQHSHKPHPRVPRGAYRTYHSGLIVASIRKSIPMTFDWSWNGELQVVPSREINGRRGVVVARTLRKGGCVTLSSFKLFRRRQLTYLGAVAWGKCCSCF